MILQQLCGKGQMKQQKCARGQDGTILATVKVETPCNVCPNKVNWIQQMMLHDLADTQTVTHILW
jgi:hypothetical protein